MNTDSAIVVIVVVVVVVVVAFNYPNKIHVYFIFYPFITH